MESGRLSLLPSTTVDIRPMHVSKAAVLEKRISDLGQSRGTTDENCVPGYPTELLRRNKPHCSWRALLRRKDKNLPYRQTR